MEKMIAEKAFTYRGRQLCVGEAFDADDEHVVLFKTIGFARERSQDYQTRVMTASRRGARKAKAA